MKLEDVDIGAIALPKGRKARTFTSTRARGLQLLVKANGRKEWHLRYTRSEGGRNSVAVGLYPDVTEDDAVALAAQHRALIDKGIDPAEHKRHRTHQKRSEQFLKGQAVEPVYRLSKVAADFLADCEDRLRRGTVKKYRCAINRHILPEHGGDDIRFIDVGAFEFLVRRVAKESKAAAANLLATDRALLSFAVDRGILQANPLLGRKTLVRATKVEPRAHVFSGRDLHRFLNELPEQPISEDAKLALLLQLHTGLRIGEVLAIEWSGIDFRARTITHKADDMKGGQKAETVMADAVRRLLLEWKRDHGAERPVRVFREGLDTDSITVELRKLRGWLGPTFRTHDLRRTVRTGLQELGCPLEIRAAITNHTRPQGVARHYDHAKGLAAQLEWLEKWAQTLEAVKRDPGALVHGIEAGDDDPLLAEFGDVL